MHKTAVLLSFFSLLSALLFNELNLQELKHNFPDQYSGKFTVSTYDDASYLTPPVNFLNGNGWHSNDVGTGSYVFRTPGYGLFYLFNKIIAGDDALWLLRNLQLLLFAFSVYLLFMCCFILTKNKLLTSIVSSIYGILPFTHGFLYYSLTEGITPFLVILFAYFLIRYYKDNKLSLIYIASIILSILIIIRPQLLILYVGFIPFYYQLIKNNRLQSVKVILTTTIITFSLLGAWQIRNYNIAGKWVALNAVYHSDNNSIFRPQHRAIGDFYKSFGANGAIFHQSVNLLWHHAINGDTSEKYIHDVMTNIPSEIIATTGQVKLIDAYKSYQIASTQQRPFIGLKISMPEQNNRIEEDCILKFDALTDKIRKKHFIQSNILVPLKTYRKLSFHSNLSLYIFQHQWRGQWWVELLRWTCAIIHSFLFIFLFFQFFIKKDVLAALLLIVPLAYLFYLCFFQIMIEERYTLPVLPLLLLGAATIINQFLLYKWKSNFQS